MSEPIFHGSQGEVFLTLKQIRYTQKQERTALDCQQVEEVIQAMEEEGKVGYQTKRQVNSYLFITIFSMASVEKIYIYIDIFIDKEYVHEGLGHHVVVFNVF